MERQAWSGQVHLCAGQLGLVGMAGEQRLGSQWSVALRFGRRGLEMLALVRRTTAWQTWNDVAWPGKAV